MNTSNPPPPGWYPDPAGRAPFRYWDGTRWTEHVQQGTAPAGPYGAQQPVPGGFATAARSVGAPGSPLSGHAFVEELKRFDGWAIVVVGFLLFAVCSFLPWTGGEISGPAGSAEDTANAWDGDGPWLIRGYEVNDTTLNTVLQGGSLDSGTDMVLLFPLAIAAAGIAIAVRNGTRFKNSAEVGLAAAGLLAILMIVEAVHVSGALDEASTKFSDAGFPADFGLEFGFVAGVLAAILMAVGALRTYLAGRQPTR